MYPDVAAQQVALQRQQQMADMLRQQSMTQNEGQMIGNQYVAPSWSQGLARMAQALMASKSQDSIDAKNLELSKLMQSRMGDAFDNMAGGSSSPIQVLGQSQNGVGAVPQEPVPQQNDQITRIRNQAKAAYLMGNTDLANKLLDNISTLTNEQRNMSAMGQDPRLMGQLDTAAKRKAGIIELQPGTTALDLSNGQERFQPKVGEGISLNNGIASQLPGYAAANAGIQGAQAGAVASAQAGNKMITVNTPSGPMMMTEADAVKQSSPKPESGLAGNFSGPVEDVLRQIDAIKDPQEKSNALSAYANQMTNANPKTGIKLQDQGSSAFETKMGNQQADMLTGTYEKAKTAADDLLGISESRKAIKGGVFLGSGAETKLAIAKFVNSNIPGVTIEADKVGNTDYLKSTLGKGLLDQAKTLGSNPSNADANRINDIVGSIGKDPAAMSKILDWRQSMAERAIQMHNNSVDQAAKSGFNPQFDMHVRKPSVSNGFKYLGKE